MYLRASCFNYFKAANNMSLPRCNKNISQNHQQESPHSNNNLSPSNIYFNVTYQSTLPHISKRPKYLSSIITLCVSTPQNNCCNKPNPTLSATNNCKSSIKYKALLCNNTSQFTPNLCKQKIHKPYKILSQLISTLIHTARTQLYKCLNICFFRKFFLCTNL
jgi:hypothetical protein